jgi:hypothetical protein
MLPKLLPNPFLPYRPLFDFQANSLKNLAIQEPPESSS